MTHIFACRAPGLQEGKAASAGNFSTKWGPQTKFSKSNHPLAIMVCLKQSLLHDVLEAHLSEFFTHEPCRTLYQFLACTHVPREGVKQLVLCVCHLSVIGTKIAISQH